MRGCGGKRRALKHEALTQRCLLTVSAELLADINIGDESSLQNTVEWVQFEEHLYFAADDGVHGTELWRTDGTADGTEMVADINEFEGSFPTGLTVFNDELYFAAIDSQGDELWKTDGTEIGTVQVKDINEGAESSGPLFLQVFDGMLYFSAETAIDGAELWRTDGTEAGTEIVLDLEPSDGGSFPTHLKVFDGELYFSAAVDGDGPELYKTDGTEAGTVLVKDIHAEIGEGSFPESFFEFKNELYFIAADALVPTGGLSSHLYKSDGTEQGTVRVTPERLTINLKDKPNVVEFKSHLYFGGLNEFSAWELYRTDGQPDNTELVMDLSGAFSGAPAEMTVFQGQLYFAGNDAMGRQLWRTNGEPRGANVTERLTDIMRANSGMFPSELTVFNDALIWNGHDGTAFQVWMTDGQENKSLTNFEANATSEFFSLFVEFNDKLLFRGSGPDGLELWSVNPSADVDPPVVLPGDVDGNGKVEFADFLILSENFGKDVSGRAEGDLDENGRVEFADFLQLSENFGRQIEAIFFDLGQ